MPNIYRTLLYHKLTARVVSEADYTALTLVPNIFVFCRLIILVQLAAHPREVRREDGSGYPENLKVDFWPLHIHPAAGVSTVPLLHYAEALALPCSGGCSVFVGRQRFAFQMAYQSVKQPRIYAVANSKHFSRVRQRTLMAGKIRRLPILLTQLHCLAEQWERHAWSRLCYASSSTASPNFKEHQLLMEKYWKEMEELKQKVEEHTREVKEGKEPTIHLMM